MTNKPKEVKTHKPLEGNHVVSPDGSKLFIGGRPFKRTVLPGPGTSLHANGEDEINIDATEPGAISEIADSNLSVE